MSVYECVKATTDQLFCALFGGAALARSSFRESYAITIATSMRQI